MLEIILLLEDKSLCFLKKMLDFVKLWLLIIYYFYKNILWLLYKMKKVL